MVCQRQRDIVLWILSTGYIPLKAIKEEDEFRYLGIIALLIIQSK
jgi:hypothetical protein